MNGKIQAAREQDFLKIISEMLIVDKMKKSVLIVMPSTTHIWAATAIDLLNLAVCSVGKYDVGVINIQNPLLPISRDNSVLFARRHKMNYIFFIDSDMRFPQNGLDRLMLCGKDIIGCNAAVKGENRAVIEKDIDGCCAINSEKKIIEVERIGMAFTLINMSVFEKIKRPYFYIEYSEDGVHHWGEDTSFCETAKSSGYKIYCDTVLSNEIGHLGEKNYLLKDIK